MSDDQTLPRCASRLCAGFLRWIGVLTPDEERLYVLVALSSGPDGRCDWHPEQIRKRLGLTLDQFLAARGGLSRRGMIIWESQPMKIRLLPLPEAPNVYRRPSSVRQKDRLR